MTATIGRVGDKGRKVSEEVPKKFLLVKVIAGIDSSKKTIAGGLP